MENSNKLEIRRSKSESEHGLCESAETHWAIYLIQLVKNGLSPEMFLGNTVDGEEIVFIKKGEDPRIRGFSFGADSYVIVSASIPELQYMLLVEEEPDVYVGRPLASLADALVINDFYDKDLQSKWKDVIADFARERNIEPKQISLVDLIKEITKL